ncbi:hypothetical protein [Ramlibacter albus]|uniref:Lipoprotein n=1 Tax=Ramlibacter albus TaxID=2079448 RepID=A0A923M3G1_9BURK|nr:hypothetical protein [Ramlibacter albus]MBC5763230.1 hypothetical protein [Ramlibacter albus]
MKRVALVLLALTLSACGNKPRQPDWLVNADGAQDRFERAYLSGRDKAATDEFARLRHELSSTGDPSLIARGELTRCAVQVASLQLDGCPGFEPLRRDASDAERAYADFLLGKFQGDPKQLPEVYRGVAGGAGGAKAVEDIKEPLSRVIAAAVVFRTGRADPGVLQAAVDTASQQGWRRALIAWLGAQAMLAEKNGDTETAQRLRRRIALAAEEK